MCLQSLTRETIAGEKEISFISYVSFIITEDDQMLFQLLLIYNYLSNLGLSYCALFVFFCRQQSEMVHF